MNDRFIKCMSCFYQHIACILSYRHNSARSRPLINMDSYLKNGYVLEYTAHCSYLFTSDEEIKDGTETGRQRLRDVAERALTSAGLHVTRGHLLWDAYRSLLLPSI